jgi:hypothetical protein
MMTEPPVIPEMYKAGAQGNFPKCTGSTERGLTFPYYQTKNSSTYISGI